VIKTNNNQRYATSATTRRSLYLFYWYTSANADRRTSAASLCASTKTQRGTQFTCFTSFTSTNGQGLTQQMQLLCAGAVQVGQNSCSAGVCGAQRLPMRVHHRPCHCSPHWDSNRGRRHSLLVMILGGVILNNLQVTWLYWYKSTNTDAESAAGRCTAFARPSALPTSSRYFCSTFVPVSTSKQVLLYQ
jgi:hypothetical protein